jgi:D-xylose transport system substrate-binding protein
MRKAMLALVAGLLATGSMTACTDDNTNSGTSSSNGGGAAKGGGSESGKIGVILPDEKSSQRWTQEDPKYLKQAFDSAGIPVDIQNAKGDKARFGAIADQMINGGVKVLMIVNLDSPTGKAVLDKAKAAKIKTVDYDRLTLNGGADYYVSFDNRQVGVLQGTGLVRCLRGVKTPIVAEVNGSPTDNNATLFKEGYDSVLQPLYDEGTYIKGPDQPVDDWDNAEGGKIFEQMWQQQPKISGVLAANDGLGGAVIDVLRKGKKNGQIPVTGQDATVPGLQNILIGDQCMTVYKAIRPEAEAAARLAIDLYKGRAPTAASVQQSITKIKDPESGAYVPFVSLSPVAVTKDNIMKTVIHDNFVTVKQLCTGNYAKLCAENDIK